MRLSDYLSTHFYHTDELCQALNIDTETLENWQAQSIFPKPSYCIKNQMSIPLLKKGMELDCL